ncbi:MAG: hypothetical protein OXI25_06635 [Chloroflexota bacterium]|nr:hypothetical protein [Chloroflexota bacterium]
MAINSVERLGAISLIVGPIVSFIFFLVRPGVLLVDMADSTDEAAQITALASNSTLTHVAALIAPVALVITLYGLYVAQSRLRDGSRGDALMGLGFMSFAVGTIGWITGLSLQHVLANTELGAPGAVEAMEPVYAVQAGVTLLSTLLVALGFLCFTLGAAQRSEFSRVRALVVAAASIVSAASLTVGIILPETAAVSVAIARGIYIFWVVWLVLHGARILKSSNP